MDHSPRLEDRILGANLSTDVVIGGMMRLARPG